MMGLIAEVTEDLVSNSEPAAVLQGSLHDADQLFEDGCASLRADDFDAAVDYLSRALEIRVQHYGELASELASTYYKYGCALLYKVQAETDVLGEPAMSKEKITETHKLETEEVAKGSDENSDEGESEEEIQEDEETDLELAWKMLDIARVIHERQHTHTIAEVDVITALGDLSLEKEDFQTSFDDYTRALEILKGLVEPDDRQLAELNFKLALVQELGSKFEDAIEYCLKASSICESRLQRLKAQECVILGCLQGENEQLEGCEAVDNVNSNVEGHAQIMKVAQEVKDIEQLLVDLKEKVDDLCEMKSAPRVFDTLQNSSPAAFESLKQVFLAASAAGLANGKVNVDDPSQAQQINKVFDEPSQPSSSSNSNVTHLGVVGRGVKRAAPLAISPNDLKLPERQLPKRSFEHLSQGNGAGETQIGFNTISKESANQSASGEVIPVPTSLDKEPSQG